MVVKVEASEERVNLIGLVNLSTDFCSPDRNIFSDRRMGACVWAVITCEIPIVLVVLSHL